MPAAGICRRYRGAIVCGSQKSIRFRASAITSAYWPSGVKYRLYGSATATGEPARPVRGSMGVSLPPTVLFTHSTEPSQDGVTWLGPIPTSNVVMTRWVRGSISVTVLLRLFGTYTRTLSRAQRGFILPGAISASTFTGAGFGAGVGEAGGRVGVATSTAGAARVSVVALL